MKDIFYFIISPPIIISLAFLLSGVLVLKILIEIIIEAIDDKRNKNKKG